MQKNRITSCLCVCSLFFSGGTFCAASASRSFIARAIAPVSSFVSSHPRLTKTAGVGAAAVGAYVLYKWWKDKRRVLGAGLASSVLPTEQQPQRSVPEERVVVRVNSIEEFQAMTAAESLTPAEERAFVSKKLYDIVTCLPKEIVSLIVEYHQTPFRGRLVQHFDVNKGRLSSLRHLVLLSGDRVAVADFHDIKIWNLKTNKCCKYFTLGEAAACCLVRFQNDVLLMGSFGYGCLIDSNSEKHVRVFKFEETQYPAPILSMIPLSSQAFIYPKFRTCFASVVDVETGRECCLQLPKIGDSCLIYSLDSHTLAFSVSKGSKGWIGLIDPEVLLKKTYGHDEAFIGEENFKLILRDMPDVACLVGLQNKKLAIGLSNGCIIIGDYEKGIVGTPFDTLFGARETLKSITELSENRIAVGTNSSVKIWDVSDEPIYKQEIIIDHHGDLEILESINELSDNSIVVTTNKSVKVWNISGNEPVLVKELVGTNPVLALADGRLITADDRSDQLKLWE